MRSPLTSTIFALELTQDINVLPALLIASVVAHGLTVLVMKRSILTEKVARRGFHISREYAIDPLERLSIGEVMTTDVVTVPASLPLRELVRGYFFAPGPRKHPGYPVVDKEGRFFGVITRSNLLEHWLDALTAAPGGVDPLAASPIIAYDLIEAPPVVAYADESCREAAERMASAGVKRLPVVAPDDPCRLVGIVVIGDLLKARQWLVEEEAKRERFFGQARARRGSQPGLSDEYPSDQAEPSRRGQAGETLLESFDDLKRKRRAIRSAAVPCTGSTRSAPPRRRLRRRSGPAANGRRSLPGHRKPLVAGTHRG